MKIKTVLLSFIICTLLVININPVFADSFLQKIEVLINSVSLFVNNEQVAVDNFIYNGTTYVPLRAVAEMNGMEVKWDDENKRIDLVSNEAFNMKTTDGKYNIIYMNPEPLTDGNYLRWDFINIVFDSDTKKTKNINNVVLTNYKGNKINVKCQPGLTKKNNFLIIPEKELELNTYYSLYIPKNNIVMENGDLYEEEILIYFKTATNVVSGKISANKKLFGTKLLIKDNNENTYETYIVGDVENEFYFTNLPAGKYEVTIGDNSYGSISVEENRINNVRVLEK